MVFGWWRKWRRARLIASPFPEAWHDFLKPLTWYARLHTADQQRLQNLLRVFIAEKNWEGCQGFVATDETRVTIAAMACYLLLGIEHDYFSHVLSILIYPAEFVAPTPRATETGIFFHEQVRLGEAHYRGPVVLSWKDVLENIEYPEDGNVVWHEFAHQLDMQDRGTDGTPVLGTLAEVERWREVMTTEFNQLRHAISAQQETLLDPYGATNEAEFFAVCTEAFFCVPRDLRAEHPALYDLLRDYFCQDPAAR
jgi:Mlc titration factor MtfA (ptsG expression regulator)